MAAQLTFVFRKALSCRHKISFSGLCAAGVLFYNTFSYSTNVLQQLTVADNIRDLQIESDTALLCTFKITGTTQFQIGTPLFQNHHWCAP